MIHGSNEFEINSFTHVFVNVNTINTHHLCHVSTFIPTICMVSDGPHCMNMLSFWAVREYAVMAMPHHTTMHAEVFRLSSNTEEIIRDNQIEYQQRKYPLHLYSHRHAL